MFENLVVKASGVLSAIQMLRHSKIDPAEIDYVIECSEEACGDINQRGGGNFAKSIAEIAGLQMQLVLTQEDFVQRPTHALFKQSFSKSWYT